ncbi:Zinc finger, C6HC-type [Corchorus capsularis]|uniref:RBR-type E3 ubiquitin transferase n=1 Tax=Corchorus capsularis TaxID=210143 RepID=A0A1R3HL11_COCAP|nr:Zinc finger, C6HC-type [Corchorus capsularis]
MGLIDKQQLGYSVLDESIIKQRQEDDLTSVSTLLSVTKSESIILLRHYNWNVGEVLNQWFDGEEGIRNSLGLLKKTLVNDFERSECKEKITNCKICFESFPRQGFSSASCGHPFCFGCWGVYIGSTIKEHGRGCLSLRCPEPSCNAAVGKDMIDKLGSEEDKSRYSDYLLRSYVEDNKYIKRCPAPGCKYAINQNIDSRNLDVTCVCGHSFCWNCNQESHRPVNCEVGKLIGERMSFSWIIEHCKACPKCKKPIEKDPKGCHHMKCSPPCNFEFCWLCLVKWSNKHGGGNECRIWEKNKSLLVQLEAKRKRVMVAKLISSDRKYYWESKGTVLDVNSSGQLEREQLIKKLTNSLGIVQLHENRLKFINDAWLQIGKCRHILRCTYAYGYSIPEHENGKKQFHQYLQEEAMSMLTKLHQCADKEFKEFVDAKRTIKEFDCFTAKLIGLTRKKQNQQSITLCLVRRRELLSTDFLRYGVVDSWSQRGTLPPGISNSVHLNGAIHWLGYGNGIIGKEPRFFITAFDLTKENFFQIPIPVEVVHKYVRDFEYDLQTVGGCLCMIIRTDPYMSRSHFWVMEKYGVKESWRKISFTFAYDFLTPLYFPKNEEEEEEEALFLADGRLFLYNYRNGSQKMQRTIPAGYDMAFSIVESLVSLGMSKSREQGGISKQKRLKS